MPDSDALRSQQELLAAYRQTLAHLLQQAAAHGGLPFAPAATANGIAQARADIARTKRNLRDAGIEVIDAPDDEAVVDRASARPEHAVGTANVAWPREQRRRRWMVLSGAVVATVGAVILLLRWVAGPGLGLLPTTQEFKVNGQAMLPTFAPGQVVTIEPVEPAALRRGDVVVIAPFGTEKEPFLKRIIGLPGDAVSISEGRLYVNGELLNELYVAGATTCRVGDLCTPPTRVLNGSVYVLGDNRGNSSDSREFGVVPISEIKGRVR